MWREAPLLSYNELLFYPKGCLLAVKMAWLFGCKLGYNQFGLDTPLELLRCSLFDTFSYSSVLCDSSSDIMILDQKLSTGFPHQKLCLLHTSLFVVMKLI